MKEHGWSSSYSAASEASLMILKRNYSNFIKIETLSHTKLNYNVLPNFLVYLNQLRYDFDKASS